jgi:hypothetical protein
LWQKHDSGLGVALRVASEKESKAKCVLLFTWFYIVLYGFISLKKEFVSGRNSGLGSCNFLEAIGEVNASRNCWNSLLEELHMRISQHGEGSSQCDASRYCSFTEWPE